MEALAEEGESSSEEEEEDDDQATQLFRYLDVNKEGRIPVERVISALVAAGFNESFFHHVRSVSFTGSPSRLARLSLPPITRRTAGNTRGRGNGLYEVRCSVVNILEKRFTSKMNGNTNEQKWLNFRRQGRICVLGDGNRCTYECGTDIFRFASQHLYFAACFSVVVWTSFES